MIEGESGEQMGGELESVTSSAGCFMQRINFRRTIVSDGRTALISACSTVLVLCAMPCSFKCNLDVDDGGAHEIAVMLQIKGVQCRVDNISFSEFISAALIRMYLNVANNGVLPRLPTV